LVLLYSNLAFLQPLRLWFRFHSNVKWSLEHRSQTQTNYSYEMRVRHVAIELVDRQDTALFSLTVHSLTLMNQIQTVFRDPSFVEKLMGFNITKW